MKKQLKSIKKQVVKLQNTIELLLLEDNIAINY